MRDAASDGALLLLFRAAQAETHRRINCSGVTSQSAWNPFLFSSHPARSDLVVLVRVVISSLLPRPNLCRRAETRASL